jgi:F0F1-type ATP synthase assembly protein I
MAGWMTLYSLIALSTLPLSALAVRQALASYEKSFELVPANASTVLSHLLTGMFLTLGYVLDGFALPASWTLVVSIVLLVVTLMLSAKIHRQKAPPEEV